jgi:hypothetical protein
MADINIYQGNSWTPAVSIKEDGSAKDCSAYDCKLLIKETDDVDADIVLEEDISWTNQSQGLGTFTVLPSETEALSVKSYYYEVVLYNESALTYRKTVDKGRLAIRNSLGID